MSTESNNNIPKLNSAKFTGDNCSQTVDAHEADRMQRMVGGWKPIGWNLSESVAPSRYGNKKFVCMFEREGQQLWCHCDECVMVKVSEEYEKNQELES